MLFLETRLFVVVAQDNLCANGLFLNAAVVVVLAAVVVVVRQISKAGQNLFKFWITDSFPFYLVSFLGCSRRQCFEEQSVGGRPS